MDLAVIVAIDFVYAIATLALISLGLAIVFGMMRIINLAHGEFMVMGSYSAAVAVHYGINIWLAILVSRRSRSGSSASFSSVSSSAISTAAWSKQCWRHGD